MRSKSTRLIVLLIAALLVSFVAAPGIDAANRKGAKAPEIAITDGILGVTKKTKIADYKGSVTLLVIWLPVCPRCKKFMPTIPTLQKKYEKKGLKVLTVTHGKKDYTAQFMRQRKWNFGVGFDWTGVTAKRYGMKGMPGIYLIGKDGHLRSYTGSLDAAIAEELAVK